MIWLNGYNLTQHYGLTLSKAPGLFNFPAIKQQGTDWSGEELIEASTRKRDFQYESRKITLECFVKGTSWSNLESRLNSIATAIKYDGLRMLVLPANSLRGYMVRLYTTTIFKPFRYFESGVCVAVFKITFIEPQPMNIQWSFFYPASKLETGVFFNVEDTTAGASTDSFAQKFVTINEPFTPASTNVNLEADDYTFDETLPVSANVPYPVIVTGEIDNVNAITIAAEDMPVGLAVAELFTRGGTVTYTEL